MFLAELAGDGVAGGEKCGVLRESVGAVSCNMAAPGSTAAARVLRPWWEAMGVVPVPFFGKGGFGEVLGFSSSISLRT